MSIFPFQGKPDIDDKLNALIKRFPHLFKKELLDEKERLCLIFSEEFLALRTINHLLKMVLAFFFFQKILLEKIRYNPDHRVLLTKTIKTHLQFPLGAKRVLALVILLNLQKEYERFSERHILKVIRSFIPYARMHKNSYFSYYESVESTCRIYLEIEKCNGEGFSLVEITTINQELRNELKKSIQTLSPSLVALRNEEEYSRRITILNRELEKGSDLPQVMISFHSQTYTGIKFDVTCLRSTSRNGPTLRLLAKQLDPSLTPLFERETLLNSFTNGQVREASVFVVEMCNEPFLRKDHSIDLLRARKYIVESLNTILGSFRDYNGGFIQKQNEQFALILDHLGKRNEFLLETFFYSISPVPMQGCLDLLTLIDFAKAFLTLIPQTIPKEKKWIKHQKEILNRGSIFFLKTFDGKLAKNLSRTLEEQLLDSAEYAISTFEIEETHFFGFLCLSCEKQKKEELQTSIDKVLDEWHSSYQSLRIPICSLPFSLDPHVGIDRQGRMVQRALFEGLTRIGPDGSVQNAACERVEISNCQKQYRFFLRSSMWSNGDRVTAIDFVWAWRRALSPDSDSLCVKHFSLVQNAQKIRQKEFPLEALGVQAIDDKTLLVVLERPFPYFLELVASTFFLPLYRGQENERGIVCNGPFKKLSSSSSSQLILGKNPYYWDSDVVKLEKIEILLAQDPALQVELFEKGKIDWAGCPLRHLSLTTLKALLKEKNQRLHAMPVNQVFFFVCNRSHPLLKHPNIRLALSLTLKRKQMGSAFLGLVQPTHSVLPFHSVFSEQKSEDLKRGSLLFEEALVELGLRRESLAPLCLTHSDIPGQKEIAMMAAAQWRKALGIEIKIEELEMTLFFSKLGVGELEIGGCLWDSALLDPLGTLEGYKMISWGHPLSKKEDDVYSKFLEEAADMPPGNARRQILEKAESTLLESRGLIPVYAEKFKFLVNERAKGIFVSKTGQMDFKWASIDEKK